jgi:hypothetical protein
MQVGSLVEWCIMNKTSTKAHIGKNYHFQVAHSIGQSLQIGNYTFENMFNLQVMQQCIIEV